MDLTAQVYEAEATGWRRGLYADVTATFRAPFVNWIFRTTMANYPSLLRYAWGQVKPIFQTRAFGQVSADYRDAVLSPVDLPTYRRADLGLPPAEYRELCGQLATFDVVAPRLAVLFETVDRGLSGDLSPDPRPDRAATEPLPAWLDADRGRSPTMTAVDPEAEGAFGATVASIRDVHDLGPVLPSIYRCLAQWPGYLTTAWPAVEDALDALDRPTVFAEVASFVDALPYRPRLSPADLEAAGFETETTEDLRGVFDAFNQGPDGTVLPAIHLHAATVGASGHRGPV
ncbi:MAG: halocarboxylic acid dehydrogenase DehI family protein [Haloarculaceae archaeon]